MKKRITALSVLLSVLLLCACGQTGTTDGPYQLYFLTDREAGYGSALATQEWEGNGVPLTRELLQALLDGPTQEGLTSPFPRGVTIQELEVDAEDGVLHLTLSDHYSGLTDMSQTLADACIVMTLCQLPGIRAVEISTDGFWASRPASRTLTPEQLELSSLLP